MDDEGFLGILAGNDLDDPGVRAHRHNLLRHEPVGGVLADAGRAAIVGGVLGRELLEEVAPAGVDDDDVALAQRHVVHLEAGLQVGAGDHGALVEAGLLARRVALELAGRLEHLHHVDDHAAGRERLQVLEAEPRHVVLVDVFAHRRLVVIAVLAPDVAHAVQVRPDVTLAEPRVLHVRQLVLAEGGARGEAGRGEDRLRETRSEERHAVRERVGHRDDLAGLDLGGCGLRHRGGDPVGRTGLVVGTPRRGRHELLAIGLGERS